MPKPNLIELRESRNLSRYRVARDLDMTDNKLARIENPQVPTVRRDDLAKLLDYYGPELTIDHFLP